MNLAVATLLSLLLVHKVAPFSILPCPTTPRGVTCRRRSLAPPTVLFYKNGHEDGKDQEGWPWKYLGKQHQLQQPTKTIGQRLRSFFHRLPVRASSSSSSRTAGPRPTTPSAVKHANSLTSRATTRSTNRNWKAPMGPRWAMAAPAVNLAGVWKPVITASFLKAYDIYLQGCGSSWIFANLAKSVCGLVTEVIAHEGTALTIAGTTPVGAWKRTLLSTGANANTHDARFTAHNVTVVDPDGDRVAIESCWQNEGRTHVSWLRDKPRARGGVIESRRFLDDEGYLICQSLFHPAEGSPPNFQEASVTWTFVRMDES